MRRLVWAHAFAAIALLLILTGVLRLWYHSLLRDLSAEAEHRARVMSEEDAARWAVKARNEAKLEVRRFDLDFFRVLAEQRNQKRYGNPVGPSYEDLAEGEKHSAADIIQSAGRSNAVVDVLVLGLGGLGVVMAVGLSVWAWRLEPRLGWGSFGAVLVGLMVGLLMMRGLGWAVALALSKLSEEVAWMGAVLGAIVGLVVGVFVGVGITRRLQTRSAVS